MSRFESGGIPPEAMEQSPKREQTRFEKLAEMAQKTAKRVAFGTGLLAGASGVGAALESRQEGVPPEAPEVSEAAATEAVPEPAAEPAAEAPGLGRQTEIVDLTREMRESIMPTDLDFASYWPIYSKDTGIKWSRLLEPGYLSVSKEGPTTEQKTVEVVIPALWAEYFNTADWEDPETRAKLGAYVDKQVQAALVDEVHGLYWDKDDFEKRKDRAGEDWKLTSALVIGTASPEAGRPESVIPGNTEPENIKLAADVRGTEAAKLIVESLSRLGFDVDESLVDVTGSELQFSEEEYAALTQMAKDAGKKGSSEAMVWKLIDDYNKGRLADDLTEEQMDRLVGDKRMVTVELEMEREKKDTYLIPLPVLLLLMLRRPKLRMPTGGLTRGPGKKTPGGPPGEPPTTPPEGPPGTPPVEGPPPGETTPPPETLSKPPRETVTDTIPPGEEISRDPQEFVTEIGVDIDRHFDFYVPLIESYKGSADPDVNEMTHDILDAWTENDNAMRAAAGLEPESHQKENPRQVFYANLHARALKSVILEARKQNISEQEVWNKPEGRKEVADGVLKEVKRLQELEK